MAAQHHFFYEDEVYRINKKGNVEFGMVLENSELVSSDENSDIEEGGRMKKGHIRVAWHPTGVEVIPERKVHLADRSLMPGDVVRRMIKGKDTQRGYCRDIKVTANVQVVGTKQVIPNVKSEHLIPLEEFATDIAACLDSWVGGIKSVHSKLHVLLADGSKCVINDLEACGLEDFTEKRGDCQDCEFTSHREDFYPGQTLWGPLHCLEDAEWLHCTKEMKALRNKPNKTVKVVVEEVKTDCVGVHWQCRAYSKEGAGVEKEQPKYLVQGEDLKRLRLLNVFEPCTLQVGDRNFYTYREEDSCIQKEQWRRSQRELVFNATNGVNNSPLNAVKRSPKRVRNKEPQATDGASQLVATANATDSQATPGGDKGVLSAQPVVPMEVTPGGEEEEWDTEDTASVSDAASISSGASSIGSQGVYSAAPILAHISKMISFLFFWFLSYFFATRRETGRKKRGPALMTKVLKKKKLRRTRKKPPPVPLVPGVQIVVETLSTSSIADVVWQDGSVELGIPSTQLYPIHHLDDQEFFPGDFVIENKEDACMQVYGVVQSVDHAGRTAAVKWFKTYTSTEQPQPSFLEQNEVSVYDLKDHPDFQYRPGTVVIRVANFEGEDVNCTAGQVLDNYPEGMVRVWWVDGHISMSWPQDLYKVGEYDSDEGELWDDNSSDASWETESEDCVVFDDDKYPEEDLQEILKPKLGANIEKARIAMSRLEEIFTQNPALQTTSVMRQLLDVYKDCRYLDRLMGTSFFHESHFQGLLERVRERGRANVAQRVADQVNRLFSTESTEAELTSTTSFDGSKKKSGLNVTEENFVVSHTKDKLSNDFIECKFTCNSITPKGQEDSGVSSNSTSNKDSCGSSANESFTSGEFLLSENLVNLERHVVTAANNSKNNELFEVDENSKETKDSKTGLRTIGFNKQRCLDEKMESLRHSHVSPNMALDENIDKKPESMDVTNGSTPVDSLQSRSGPWSVSSSHVCVRLCSLIKAQLVKAHGEVTRRFGGNQGLMALSDALNDASDVPMSDQNGEEVSDMAEKDPLNIGLRSLLCSKSSPLICAISGDAPVAQETDTTLAADNTNTVGNENSNANTVVKVPSVDPVKENPPVATSIEGQGVKNVPEGEPMVESNSPEGCIREAFSIMDSAPNSHKFKLTMFQPTDPPNFFRTIRKELKLLRSSLPEGIWVKGFEDRMDLYSVMIRGPEKTPYESGLFFFDFQLSADYPRAPPLCHYISYCSDRLNPNLYEDGKVCVSLLGTWSGKGTEVWTSNSNLLQVIVSIQGLILVSEPYFNEAGYEKQKGSQQGKENSRMYNEMAVLKLVQAMTKLILQPPSIFKEEILDHFRENSGRLLHRLDTWLEISERYNNNHPVTPTTPTSFKELHGEAIASAVNVELPEFPLIPASKGFCLSLRKSLVTFRDVLGSVGITPHPPPS